MPPVEVVQSDAIRAVWAETMSFEFTPVHGSTDCGGMTSDEAAAVPVSIGRDPPTTRGVSTSRNKRNLAVAYDGVVFRGLTSRRSTYAALAYAPRGFFLGGGFLLGGGFGRMVILPPHSSSVTTTRLSAPARLLSPYPYPTSKTAPSRVGSDRTLGWLLCRPREVPGF